MSGDVAMVVPYGWLSVSPSLQNECRVLVDNGYDVEVFYFNDEYHSEWVPDAAGIQTHALANRASNAGFIPGTLVRIEQLLHLRRHVSVQEYDLLIGVDIMGLLFATTLIRGETDPPPVVYHSLESMLETGARSKWIERAASRQATYGITMAESWAEGIASRTHLDERDIFVVPNSSIATDSEFDDNFLHEWLEIPDDERIVVYGGSFVPNHQIAEIIETVANWPEGWNFVAHGWGPEKRIPDLEERAGELLDSRVFISNEVLPDDEYTSLIASADVGVALYGKGNEPKWQYGHPGKVYKYLETGTPVIASKTPSLAPIVEGNDCGVCISSAEQIPTALRKLSENYAAYSDHCLSAFEQYEFASNYEIVIDELREAGILA